MTDTGSKPEGKAYEGVAAVSRALSILDAFRGTKGVLTLKEIAEATQLYKSTILRLLVSLEHFGYVRRLGDKGYQIGPKVAELAAVYQTSFNLRDYVVPVLEKIVEEANESASLYIPEERGRLCLFRVNAAQSLRYVIREGDVLPMTNRGAGFLLTRFSSGLPDELSLDEAVAIAPAGDINDLTGIASPVFGVGGKLIGALVIGGPASRFTDDVIRRLSALILRHAIALSLQLGAPAQPFAGLLASEGNDLVRL